MARSRRTSAMLVNRCSSELSGHQNHERNQKVTTSRHDKGNEHSVERHFQEGSAELQIPRLRSESVAFSISLVVCGRKAPKSIRQQASPGFLRLRSGQALRLRAISSPSCDRSARRFAQDDGFEEGVEKHLVRCAKRRRGPRLEMFLTEL